MRAIILPLLVIVICASVVTGCVRFKSKRGVEVAWQGQVVEELKRGSSTRRDVLDILGPPSQVISLDEETVLYYLFEKAEGEGVILIVYNSIEIDTRYDRAIFFFDENDVLTDFSTRVHEHEEE
jgi:outer membrane protein assembly factor BamE (lipoprotein component of BamABCDE complex)